MSREDFRARVQEIAGPNGWFQSLNPFSGDGAFFNIEDANYTKDESGKTAGVRGSTPRAEGAVPMRVRFWSSGRRRAGLRLTMAGFILVGVTTVSVAALPASKAGAVTPAATWTEQSPAATPPTREGASMAYDPATGEMVLFGGEATAAFLDDTWTWNGTTWTQLSPATSPPARYGASMAFDPATGDMVLFGGVDTSGLLDDTWTWDGSTWTEQSPATSPPARYAASMAYDPGTGNMVLFGGDNGSTYFGDTWTWDGTTWTKQSPATPRPLAVGVDGLRPGDRGHGPLRRLQRVHCRRHLDLGRQHLDGSVPGHLPLRPLRRLHGLRPSHRAVVPLRRKQRLREPQRHLDLGRHHLDEQSPATSPSPRIFASMAYDPATGDMVLFGGSSGATYRNDTWTWPDGTHTWTQQSPATSPPARWGASMAYDPATGDMVLFGGYNSAGTGQTNDTWTWNGTTWTQQSPATTPPPASTPPWPTTRPPGTWSSSAAQPAPVSSATPGPGTAPPGPSSPRPPPARPLGRLHGLRPGHRRHGPLRRL